MIRGNTSPTSDPGESAVCHVGAFLFPTARHATRSLKPFTSISQQLALLRSRGLQIGDEQAARSALRRLGYFRFSGYAHSLKHPRTSEHETHEAFRPGASFELVEQLVDFDKALRLLVLQGLETIEIAVRAAVVDRIGRLDREGHRNPALFDARFTRPAPGTPFSPYDEWLRRFDDLCAKSKEDFVVHHRSHYGGRLPIWAAAQLLEFGMLSRLVAGLQHRDRSAVATQVGVDHPGVLKSWLHTFNVTRNRAAHHARLWNGTNAVAPLLPPASACPDLAFMHANEQARKRLFGVLCCMQILLREMPPAPVWHQQLKALIATFPESDTLSIRAAGFPDAWDKLPLWAS